MRRTIQIIAIIFVLLACVSAQAAPRVVKSFGKIEYPRVGGFCLSPDETKMLILYDLYEIKTFAVLYDTGTGKELWRKTHAEISISSGIGAVSWTADSRHVLFQAGMSIYILKASDGKVIKRMRMQVKVNRGICFKFSPKGKYVYFIELTNGKPAFLSRYDTVSGKRIEIPLGFKASLPKRNPRKSLNVRYWDVSPDNKYAVVVSTVVSTKKSDLLIIDIDAKTIKKADKTAGMVCFSPSGDILAFEDDKRRSTLYVYTKDGILRGEQLLPSKFVEYARMVKVVPYGSSWRICLTNYYSNIPSVIVDVSTDLNNSIKLIFKKSIKRRFVVSEDGKYIYVINKNSIKKIKLD